MIYLFISSKFTLMDLFTPLSFFDPLEYFILMTLKNKLICGFKMKYIWIILILVKKCILRNLKRSRKINNYDVSRIKHKARIFGE